LATSFVLWLWWWWGEVCVEATVSLPLPGLADNYGLGGGGRDGGVKMAAGLGAVGRLRYSCWSSEGPGCPGSSVNELLGSERVQSEFQQQTAIEVRNGAKKDVFARRAGVQQEHKGLRGKQGGREGGRGSGVVPPSKDDQGLDVNGASADQQSPERAAQPANVSLIKSRSTCEGVQQVCNCF